MGSEPDSSNPVDDSKLPEKTSLVGQAQSASTTPKSKDIRNAFKKKESVEEGGTISEAIEVTPAKIAEDTEEGEGKSELAPKIMTPKSVSVKPKVLTPKQRQQQEERQKKQEERDRLKREKDEEKEKIRLEKQKEKEEILKAKQAEKEKIEKEKEEARKKKEEEKKKKMEELEAEKAKEAR